ncbi:MAG: carboxypeptidase-like regulatory domain-containing protein [bacterium]
MMFKNHRILRLWPLLLGLTLGGCDGCSSRNALAPEEEYPGSVSGYIYVVGSRDHSHVLVFLGDNFLETKESDGPGTFTNREGYYNITNVFSGTYTLYAQKGDLKESWPNIKVGWEETKVPDIYLLRARLPLSAGNLWEYDLREWLDEATIARGQRKVNIQGQEVLAGVATSVIEELTYRESTQGNREQTLEKKWLYETKDGLFEYASETIYNVNAAAVSPARNPSSEKKPHFRLGNLYFSDLAQLRQFVNNLVPAYDKRSGPIKNTPNIHLYPQKILAYPVRLRESWTYELLPPSEDPSPITKEVVAQDRIFTPAGEFVCYKIKVTYDFDPEIVIEAYEWYSHIGLVKFYRKTEFWETEDYDPQSDLREEKKRIWIESWELNYYRLTDLPDEPT